jgi:pyruvate dehydrogenase E2 component (dihydrolipoamide acetyltransferase)
MGRFVMPSLGSDMEAAVLAEWLVAPGDAVARGDVIAVVETQKGAIEIEVFETGTVRELLARPGDRLPVGAPMALILPPGETGKALEPAPEAPPPGATEEAPAPPAPVEAAPAPEGHAASPAARHRAAELGMPLEGLAGTGPEGAVVLADVERARAGSGAAATDPAAQMRRAIGAAMLRSTREIPHFYLSETLDLTAAETWLETRNAARPPAERLLMGALYARATALAAARVPEMNGTVTDGLLVPAAQVNLALVIALRGGGLVAPVLADAAALTLDETMARMRDLTSRARAGRLRSSEMGAGTLTLSSLGEGGAEAMAGIIFPPQAALVSLGAPRTRPWVVDGEIRPRRVVRLTVSADHRVNDGRQAARFIAAFADALTHPETP